MGSFRFSPHLKQFVGVSDWPVYMASSPGCSLGRAEVWENAACEAAACSRGKGGQSPATPDPSEQVLVGKDGSQRGTQQRTGKDWSGGWGSWRDRESKGCGQT